MKPTPGKTGARITCRVLAGATAFFVALSAQAQGVGEGDAVVADAGTNAATAAIIDCAAATGNRTILTGNGVGGGAALSSPAYVIVSPTGTVYYYETQASGTATSIIAVNPATGTRTVVSGPSAGSGVAFVAVSGMVWDLASSTIVVSDSGSSPSTSGIFSVDPSTGVRTLLTGNGAGSGAALSNPQFVTVGGNGTIYYYETTAAGTADGIVALDSGTGVRTLVSGGAGPTGTGSPFVSVTGMSWDPTTSTLLVSDAGQSPATAAIIRVNPSNGNRTIVTSEGDAGASLDIPQFAAALASGGIYYVEEDAAGAANSVVSVNPANGARVVLSGGSSGSGPAFVSPAGMTAAALQPVITNGSLSASGMSGTAFTPYTITAGDSPTSFSATGLPPGLTVNASTGQISGTPTKTGMFDVTISATNSAGTATATLVLKIIANPGDISGDGNPDIFWTNTSTGERGAYLMDGTTITGWAGLGTVSTDWTMAAVADFTGDGQNDILWQNTVTGECGFYIMNGTTITGWVELGTIPVAWKIVGAGDFEGDGNSDIVWQDTVTGDCGIYIMSGTTVTGWASLGVAPTGWQIAGVGNFSGPGTPDILWQNTITGECGFYLMSGTNVVGWAELGTIATQWRIGEVANFTGNGMPDIVWQNTATGECGFYIMNGTNVTGWVELGTVPTVWQMGP